MSEVVPLADADEESRFGAKATGLGAAERTGLPVPPGIALSGRDRRRGGRGERARHRATRVRGPIAGRAARGAFIGGRRGRRGRELRRSAPHAAQRAIGRRRERGDSRDLVVGELRLGDQLPPARRPLHPPECGCRRAVAARSRRRRGDVHAEPDQPGRRAADRGELGSRRGRRCRSSDPRQLPYGPRRRGARAHTRSQEDRDPCRGRRRHGRGDRRAGARRAAVPRRRSARAAQRARRAVRAGVRTGARHRVGVRGRGALPAAMPRGDEPDRHRGRHRSEQRAARSK